MTLRQAHTAHDLKLAATSVHPAAARNLTRIRTPCASMRASSGVGWLMETPGMASDRRWSAAQTAAGVAGVWYSWVKFLRMGAGYIGLAPYLIRPSIDDRFQVR